jgi:hypothetical protein
MTMMQCDHDNFLPPFVKLSTSPYCTNISSQYDSSTHYDNNAQHGSRYNSTKRTTLPLPGESSQRTHLSTINVHYARPIDSAHFAQPMSYNSTHRSLSLVHFCNDSPASSTCVQSYIGRQYLRSVPNVDIVGSSKCHTRHLATGGVARFVPTTSWLLTQTLLRPARRTDELTRTLTLTTRVILYAKACVYYFRAHLSTDEVTCHRSWF